MDKVEEVLINQEYLNRLGKEQQRILGNTPQELRGQREQSINTTFQTLKNRFSDLEEFEFGERQQIILKLKLTRYFERKESIDTDTLFDALIETPNFINKDRGSLDHLFEVHEQKFLQKIAEARKKRAEIGDKSVSNPWENLFTTKSGDYYMARLLNMPHLEMESDFMKHCVNTSDSYINRMKRGEIEILSFRHVPTINQKTNKLEGDVPIMTIQYDLKTGVIRQIKKAKNEYLNPNDPYFDDVIDALKQLRTTKSDTGKLRVITEISPNELKNVEVEDYCVLTENGSVPFREFDPNSGVFVLKAGSMKLTPDLSESDVVKIVHILKGIDYKPEEIVQDFKKIIPGTTKLYLGPVFEGVFDFLSKGIDIFTSFPEGKFREVELTAQGEANLSDVDVPDWVKNDLLPQVEYPEKEVTLRLVILTPGQVGFPSGTTGKEFFKKVESLGAKKCPAFVGPHLREQYKDQSESEWLTIAMEPMSDADGDLFMFFLHREDHGLWLDCNVAHEIDHLDSDNTFVFCLGK